MHPLSWCGGFNLNKIHLSYRDLYFTSGGIDQIHALHSVFFRIWKKSQSNFFKEKVPLVVLFPTAFWAHAWSYWTRFALKVSKGAVFVTVVSVAVHMGKSGYRCSICYCRSEKMADTSFFWSISSFRESSHSHWLTNWAVKNFTVSRCHFKFVPTVRKYVWAWVSHREMYGCNIPLV